MPQQYNNSFINGYQNYMNNNTPFQNNPMLTTNPMFYGSIRDENFQTHANMMKLEQRRRVKNINQLGMSQDQILNYVIDPIKVIKQSKEEFDTKFSEKSGTYIDPKEAMLITREDQSRLPQWMKDIYAGRKNTPYKSILKSANILKQEEYTKKFTNEAELLVYQVTQVDKDQIRFIEELAKKVEIFEEHNGELKLIYSLSEKARHFKNFEYVQKYKHRSGYDPQDYSDLKKYYKKEQKRIDRENKRIDEMIEVILMNDEVPTEVLEQLKSSIEADVDTKEIDEMFKNEEKELERKLEKELRKELGDEEFDKIMNHMTQTKSTTESKSKVSVRAKKINKNNNSDDEKISNNSDNLDNSEDSENEQSKKPQGRSTITKKPLKAKLTVKQIENVQETKQVGKIESSDLDKYKNRKKKN